MKKRLMKQHSVSEDLPVKPRTEQPVSSSPSPRPPLTRKTSVTTSSASRAMLMRRASIQSMEIDQISKALAPEVEGRILVLDKQVSLYFYIVFVSTPFDKHVIGNHSFF